MVQSTKLGIGGMDKLHLIFSSCIIILSSFFILSSTMMVPMIVSVDCASFWLFLVLLVMVPHGLTWHVIACNGDTHLFTWEILPHTFLDVIRGFMQFYDRFE